VSDLALVAGWAWFTAVGLAWTFLIFLPWFKRLRSGPNWPPTEPPMGMQLRLIAKIVAGAVLVTAAIIALTLWEPLAGFGLGALLFYGYLTVLLKTIERHNEQAVRSVRG
jgi:hypothetical protein